MHTLRNVRHIARFMLVWFALYLSAAIASPFVHPGASAPHCAAMEAMEKAAVHLKGDTGKSIPKLDCPLCAGITAPPPAASIAIANVPLRAIAPVRIGIFHIPLPTSAPPPARGPPRVCGLIL